MMFLIQDPLWYSWRLLLEPLCWLMALANLLDQLDDDNATLVADCIEAGVREAVPIINDWRHRTYVAAGGTYPEERQ